MVKAHRPRRGTGREESRCRASHAADSVAPRKLPRVAAFLKAAQLEPDREKRIEINNQLADWMYHWAFAPGVLAVPRVVTINPKSIESWDMPRAFQASYPGA